MRRREFLASALGSTVAARATPGWAGDTLLRQLDSPDALGTPLSQFDQLLTPVPVFFVRSHFGAPALDRRRRLKVEGGARPLDLGVDDLKAFRQTTVTAVLQCAGNGRSLQQPRVPGLQWGHGAMGQAEWRGVRLVDVLEKAGVKPGNGHLRLQGADRAPAPTVPAYLRSLPLSRALDGSVLVATHMNGAPLTLSHGAPMRLVVPGWSGNHWIKWLVSLRVQAEEAEGFYQRTGYKFPRMPIAPGTAVKPEDMASLTELAVKSVIARPADGTKLAAGKQEVVGVAFSGAAIIKTVEVSLDGGGSWNTARLQGAPGAGRWQVFRHKFDARSGASHRIRARASDGNGRQQPESPQWNPSGYLWNGWHTVEVTVI